MEMRAFSAFFILSLLSIAYVSDARKDPGEYWKNIMNGEPMPKAIKDLFNLNSASDFTTGMNHFARDFDTKPNVIIYHTNHVHSEKLKP
ncbi:hypothetical protein ACJIZ3_000873 [Penstemon smallii]|uniref:Organ specific protein n=1 Tax=Penstemon smallii TaxID=265156 RepID=A0ABD3U2F3_9LAMI